MPNRGKKRPYEDNENEVSSSGPSSKKMKVDSVQIERNSLIELVKKQSEAFQHRYKLTSKASDYARLYSSPSLIPAFERHPPQDINQSLTFSLLTADLICELFKDHTTSSRLVRTLDTDFTKSLKTNIVTASSMLVATLLQTFVLDAFMDSPSSINLFSQPTVALYDYLTSGAKTAYLSVGVSAIGNALNNYRERKKIRNSWQFKSDNIKRLYDVCPEIYKALYRMTFNTECHSSDAYNCRQIFIQSMPQNGKLILDYIELPRRIIQVFKSHEMYQLYGSKDNIEEPLRRNLQPLLDEWLERIKDTKGVADEACLFLGILFAADVSIRWYSKFINELFSGLFWTTPDKYVTIVKSCFVGIMLHVSDPLDLNDFARYIQECIFPHKDETRERKSKMVKLQESIWQQLEEEIGFMEKAQKIHKNIRRRPSFNQYLDDEEEDTDVNQSEDETSEDSTEMVIHPVMSGRIAERASELEQSLMETSVFVTMLQDNNVSYPVNIVKAFVKVLPHLDAGDLLPWCRLFYERLEDVPKEIKVGEIISKYLNDLIIEVLENKTSPDGSTNPEFDDVEGDELVLRVQYVGEQLQRLLHADGRALEWTKKSQKEDFKKSVNSLQLGPRFKSFAKSFNVNLGL
jgi:hypothetical protein